jgi:hypothetical protein
VFSYYSVAEAGAHVMVQGARAVFTGASTQTGAAAAAVRAVAEHRKLRRGRFLLLRAREAPRPRQALRLQLRPRSVARLLPAVASSEEEAPLPRLAVRRVPLGHPAANETPYDRGLYTKTDVTPWGLLALYGCAL